MTIKLLAIVVAGLGLAACDRTANQSVKPGTADAGNGAGQRGGLNDGAAAGSARATPGYPNGAANSVPSGGTTAGYGVKDMTTPSKLNESILLEKSSCV